MKNARSALMPVILFSLLSMDVAKAEDPGLGKQMLGGMAYGSGGLLVGGAAGAAVLSVSCYEWGEDCGFAGLAGAFMGGVLGFSGAFPYGVYRFGTDGTYSGSLTWTYASALLGAAVVFGGWAGRLVWSLK